MNAYRSERVYLSRINRVIDYISAHVFQMAHGPAATLRAPDIRWRRMIVKRLFCWSVLVYVCAGPLARGDEAKSAKDDGKKLQGSWKPVAAELGGKPFPDEVLKTMKLVLTDGRYTVTVGEQTDEGTVKLDPVKEPRAMDIEGTKGPNKGKTIPAIYELTGSTLRICYDLSGKARPKEFKTKPDTQLFLVEYKRQKS